jgi:hypothetical protein
VITDYLNKVKEDSNKFMVEAFKKAQEKSKENRKKSQKKTGTVSLSNADSVSGAMRIRSRLYAKLDEIFASDINQKAKMTMAKDVLLQITKVEQKIVEIKRREKAIQEERMNKKNDTELDKRKRKYDMQKRSIGIRKDYLYSAAEGGFDPTNNFMTNFSSGEAAVSFDISGMSGEMVAMAAEASVEVNV